MKDYTKYNFSATQATALNYDAGLRAFMLSVYNYMAAALVLTGIVAMLAASSEAVMGSMYVIKQGRIMGMAPLGYLVAFAPVGFALLFGMGLSRMRTETAQMLFWAYAALLGLSLSSLFFYYTGESIARTFFITASVFGGMSLYGYTTKKDLTNFGSFLIMGLMGVMFASIINIFMKSSGMHFALSIMLVLIFTGLTAYDTQRIKQIYYQTAGNEEVSKKMAIVGALSLYMDFVNLFVQLLQFFGNKRDN